MKKNFLYCYYKMGLMVFLTPERLIFIKLMRSKVLTQFYLILWPGHYTIT